MMRRSTTTRLDRLDHALAPSIPDLWVQYVSTDDPRLAALSPDDAVSYVAILDQINAHADALVAIHGPGIFRHHRYRNNALDCLTIEQMEWVDDVLTHAGKGAP
jgi:hypothetical protein